MAPRTPSLTALGAMLVAWDGRQRREFETGRTDDRIFRCDQCGFVYTDDPIEMAKLWRKENAKSLHVTDVDGAIEGRLVNFDVIERMAKTVDIPIELGGGLRSFDEVKRAFDAGMYRVVLGTLVVGGATELSGTVDELLTLDVVDDSGTVDVAPLSASSPHPATTTPHTSPTTAASSIAGFVFGMHTTDVNPPRAAHRDPENLREWRESVSGWKKLDAKMVIREGWGAHYFHDLPWLHYRQIINNLAEGNRLGFIAARTSSASSIRRRSSSVRRSARSPYSHSASRTMELCALPVRSTARCRAATICWARNSRSPT